MPLKRPFAHQQAERLYVETDRKTQFDESPVRLVSWEWEGYDVDKTPSMAGLVEIWTWLLGADLYRFGDHGWQPIEWAHIPISGVRAF